MNLQRLLLRAMLATLALAGAAGVVAIFLSTFIMGRIAGTAFVAAVCIGLAIPISRMMDSERSRAGGATGLGALVLSFILFLAAIWTGALSMSGDTAFQLMASGFVVFFAGLLAAMLLPRLRTTGLAVAVRVALASDLIAASACLLAVWLDSSSHQTRLGETAGHIAGSGFAMALCLVGLGARLRVWQWPGVLAGFVQLALGLLGTWYIDSDDPSWYVCAVCVAVVIGHANIVTRVPLGEHGIWAMFAAIGGTMAAGICATLLSFATGGFDTSGPELLTKLAGASALVAACGTMAVLVLYRLNRRTPGPGASVASIALVQVVCPHCGRRCACPMGESACAGCGLLITVGVREPRCVKCDYLLLGNASPVCPECGTPRVGVAG